MSPVHTHSLCIIVIWNINFIAHSITTSFYPLTIGSSTESQLYHKYHSAKHFLAPKISDFDLEINQMMSFI